MVGVGIGHVVNLGSSVNSMFIFYFFMYLVTIFMTVTGDLEIEKKMQYLQKHII